MKQITPEIKARVFALYWGQKVFTFPENNGWEPQKVGVSYMDGYGIKNRCLLLKPLSSITDEDAIEVAKLVTGNKEWLGEVHYTALGSSVTLVKPDTTVNVTINISDDGDIWDSRLHHTDALSGHDYLRSKGYALPALGYSVEELVELGVFKLKEVNND